MTRARCFGPVWLLVLVLLFLLVGCSPAAEQTYLERAYAKEFEGTKVTVWGPVVDIEAKKFENSLASFEEATGIDIQYQGSKEFEATIAVQLENNSGPDIADFPQPGLLATLTKAGYVVDVSSFIPAETLTKAYQQSWLDMATMPNPEGQMIMAGVWHRVNAKSLVWYPKDDFDAAGYKIPQTWTELLALTDQMVADGHTPWCIGIESGAATGWPATDWVEEIMLRTTSLENYDKWTKGELPFNSPEVKKAVEIMSEIWLNDDYVHGGALSITSTSYDQAPQPMFANPPQCWLHKQGSFIASAFPAGAKPEADYDFFYLPPIDSEYGKPVLVAGDMMAMLADRPEVRAVMEYFTTAASIEGWARAGGAISPHKEASLGWYPDYTARKTAEILMNADRFRFDGSDLMPGRVGADSFWTNMTDYVSGAKSLEEALQDIDASWP